MLPFKQKSFKQFFIAFLFFLVAGIAVSLVGLLMFNSEKTVKYEKLQLKKIHNLPEVIIKAEYPSSAARNSECSYWECFNVYRCGRTGHDRITVYVYELHKYIDENGVPATGVMSKEYFQILEAIINSKYYTANKEEACLFVPSIDTLNQNRVRINITSKVLQSLAK